MGYRILDLLVETNLVVCFGMHALGIFLGHSLGAPLVWTASVSLFVWLWQIYVLDRWGGAAEDASIAAGELSVAAFIERHRPQMRVALTLSVLAQALLVWQTPRLALAIAVSIAASVFYIVPMPLVGRRLKDLPFVKHLYAPFVMTLFDLAFAGFPPLQSGRALFVTAAVFAYLATNITMFDAKDAVRDREAGLVLLSTVLSSGRFYALLIVWSLVWAALSLILLRDAVGGALAISFVLKAGLLVRLARRFSLRLLLVAGDAIMAAPLVAWVLLSR